jgi:hypothetical protein
MLNEQAVLLPSKQLPMPMAVNMKNSVLEFAVYFCALITFWISV